MLVVIAAYRAITILGVNSLAHHLALLDARLLETALQLKLYAYPNPLLLEDGAGPFPSIQNLWDYC